MSILSAAMATYSPLNTQTLDQLAPACSYSLWVKLFFEGKDMPSGNEKVLEEMREAEEEIDEDVAEHDGTGGGRPTAM